LDQVLWYPVKWYDSARRTKLDCRRRHSKNGAGGFILDDRVPAAVANVFEPFGTIGSHARQQDANRRVAEGVRRRCEQLVDGWRASVAVYGILKSQPITTDCQVPAGRSCDYGSRQKWQALAILRVLYVERTLSVNPIADRRQDAMAAMNRNQDRYREIGR